MAYAGTGYLKEGAFVRHGYGKVYHENGTLFYEGSFCDDHFYGKGKVYDENGILRYEGDVVENILQGLGKEYRENGTLWYTGTFKNGCKHGTGKLYHENGLLQYEGDFVGGFACGNGVEYSVDGILLYKGDFVDGRWTGKGVFYYENGIPAYEGDFVNGASHGMGRGYRHNGTLQYVGEYKNDLRCGQGKIFYENGTIAYEGSFLEGLPNGIGTLYYEDETIHYKGTFLNGKMHGKGTLYYEDGFLKYEGDFLDGKMSGKGTLFSHDYEDTIEYEGEFKDNKKDGKGILYEEDGISILYEGDFKENNMTGKGRSYCSGGLEYDGDFENGKWHGNGKLYHRHVINWSAGGREEGGLLHYEGEFQNGLPCGKGRAYRVDGSLWGEGVFTSFNFDSGECDHSYTLEWIDHECLDQEVRSFSDFVIPNWNGSGKVYRQDETIMYEGTFVEGYLDGMGKAYYQDGTLEYEGEFDYGTKKGRGKLYWENGILKYEGEFDDDFPNGKGKSYDENGILEHEGYFEYGEWMEEEENTEDYSESNVEDLKSESPLQYSLFGIENDPVLSQCSLFDGDFSSKKDKLHNKGNAFEQDEWMEEDAKEHSESNKDSYSTCSSYNASLSAYLQELDGMIGLSEVKHQIHTLVNLIRVQNERRERNMTVMPMSYHMVFTGNPGTGKTTVARLIAKIYANLGIIDQEILVETDRTGLVAEYLGQTAVKTDKIINQAKGGVLFIDEAYSLVRDKQDQYGLEAIDCLMKRMEDYRNDLVVIVAGYKEPMDHFLLSNPGLKSRFNRHIHFANYTVPELTNILDVFCRKNGYTMQSECRELFAQLLEVQTNNSEFMKTFSNGRYIRNLFEKLILAQGNRLAQIDISNADDHVLTELTVEDLQYLISNGEFEKTF